MIVNIYTTVDTDKPHQRLLTTHIPWVIEPCNHSQVVVLGWSMHGLDFHMEGLLLYTKLVLRLLTCIVYDTDIYFYSGTPLSHSQDLPNIHDDHGR